jgi:predicted TIM-barrel fold metal-dependent hydrolase
MIFAGAIDCDIHPAVPTTRLLLPYLDAYWADTVTMILRGIARLEMSSYPPNAPLTARPDWRPSDGRAGSDLAGLRAQALDHFGQRYAICNPLYGAQVLYNPDFAAALCSALNEWIVKEWLDHEPRLRASIVISPLDPDRGVAEIERLASDERFVQVLLLAGGELPLGRRMYWPIYRAAEHYGLPIGIHAGSMYRHPPTQSGYPSTLVEDYIAQSQVLAGQLVSFIAEGVFTKFPLLRLVLIESGVTWLPALMWRFTKDWRGVRTEVPWVKSAPAEIIRDHVRLTVQPFDGPADPASLNRTIDQLGSDRMLLFSTDYPHWQFDGDDVLPTGLSDDILRKILVDNPFETYPRLRKVAP